MNWITWKNSIINLRHVKSIYYAKESWDDAPTSWSLNVLMIDKEGKYAQHFTTEEAAKSEFERIKKALNPI